MPALTPQKIDFGIIYEDENMLVIDKPAGLTVHPAPGQPDGTLVNGLLYHCSIEDSNDLRPGIVHRLDKDTSGLILAAKNRDAREKLASMFMERTVDKRYLAFCWGVPGTDHFIIEQSIGRHPVDRKRMTVREDGRYAKSEIFVKERFKNTFLAEIKIYTGRTHQIRVHMAHAGFPVLDDQVYGGKQNRGFKINRQALHSWKLAFKSPFAHKDFAFTAPLPNDMALLKERLPVQK
jgi:23S rRNA pseudouridine1911/1915/1917 synthase